MGADQQEGEEEQWIPGAMMTTGQTQYGGMTL